MNKATRIVSLLVTAVPSLLLATAVLCICVVNFHPKARSYRIGLFLLQGPEVVLTPYEQLDNLFNNQMPSGNIWVQFEGFRPELKEHKGFMAEVYFRGNYVIYPRRIYVSDSSPVVNDGKEVVKKRTLLTPALSEKLGIHWIAVFSPPQHGGFRVKVWRLR